MDRVRILILHQKLDKLLKGIIDLIYKLVGGMIKNLQDCIYSKRLIDKLKKLDKKQEMDIPQVKKAITWAIKYHGTQLRKSGEPFYTHPLEVAYKIADYILKTDVIVGSILHDIVEDTKVTAGMILDNFGRRVEQIVDRLTRDRPCGKKLTVREIIDNAFIQSDKEVLLIKIIDRMHNLKTIDALKRDKQIKKAKETISCITAVASILGILELEREIVNISFSILHQEKGIEEVEDRYNIIKSFYNSPLRYPKIQNT